MDIQIVSGFQGTGKTTFLNKYLPLLMGKTAVIQNEFGEVPLETGEMAGDLPVKELNAGCICCSLALDFRTGIMELVETYHPDHIVIEPSGISSLSDIIKTCIRLREKEGISLKVTKLITMVDIGDYAGWAEELGTFYMDQIRRGRCIFLRGFGETTEEEQVECIRALEQENPEAVICKEDWRNLSDHELMSLIEESGDYLEETRDVQDRKRALKIRRPGK